jgi:hypothetical protein
MNAKQNWELVGQLASASSQLAEQKLQLTIANGSLGSGAKVTVGRDAASLFSVESSSDDETLADLYLRGDDLIAKYESSGDEFERELYWRIHPTGSQSHAPADEPSDLFALEMIYSLQTDLLDSQPDPSIVSTLKLQSVNYWSAVGDPLVGALKWQQQDAAEGAQLITTKLDGGTQLAIAVYPTDLIQMELAEAGGETIVTCRLNADFLEKGVIRRTRLFAVCAASAVSEEDVVQAAQTFLDSKTPLTT